MPMSYNSLYQQVTDQNLMHRIEAAAHQEAINNPAEAESDFGLALRGGYASAAQVFGWPVSVATEAPYEYALNAGNPNPGGDPSVITDADILSAVQANWPPEWPPPAAGTPPAP
jgi:hypothetical protein